MRRMIVYIKPGCHLCDHALDLLLAFRDELDEEWTIEEVNIMADPAIYDRYKHAVPVISIDPDAGGPTVHAPITASVLLQAFSTTEGCAIGEHDVEGSGQAVCFLVRHLSRIWTLFALERWLSACQLTH